MHLHSVQAALLKIWPELSKRYGEDLGEFTRPQINLTVAEIGMSEDILPYLFATFLTEAEYKMVKAEMATVDWPAVEKSAQEAYDSIQHTNWPRAHFYGRGLFMT